MIEVGLATYLRNAPTIAAIVGARIYPLRIPQHAYDEAAKMPCIVLQGLGVDRQPLFCATDRTVSAFIQVDSYAISYETALALAAALRALLVDFTGDMAGSPVKKILLETELPIVDEEPGVYRLMQTYIIWHTE